MDVSLSNRGNQVSISGAEEDCTRAAQVLGTLYHHLERGAEVTGGDVDGALRLSLGSMREPSGAQADAAEDKSAKNGKGNGKAAPAPLTGKAALRTQKREVLPRSPAQATYIEALLNSELVVGCGPAGTGKTYLAS